MTLHIPLGPVMADVGGLALTADDIRRLQHPLIGAVILFARNFQSPQQLRELTAGIRELRNPELIIAVDHEGGRVQRFHDGFTTIPYMRRLGELWELSSYQAFDMARDIGYIIGAELSAHGVDFSFTPVLDLDWGESGVIGRRAFHRRPDVVAELAGGLIDGLREAGVANCGKHFPGHGYVRADSHHEIPRDDRTMEAIASEDLEAFRLLAGKLDSIMPAHVIYERVDAQPAGFSAHWLQSVLRGQLGFSGVIFSDDLSMEGASVAGGVVARAQAAFGAGCDMVLLCNDAVRTDELLHGLQAAGHVAPAAWSDRLGRMRARQPGKALEGNARYEAARYSFSSLGLD